MGGDQAPTNETRESTNRSVVRLILLIDARAGGHRASGHSAQPQPPGIISSSLDRSQHAAFLSGALRVFWSQTVSSHVTAPAAFDRGWGWGVSSRRSKFTSLSRPTVRSEGMIFPLISYYYARRRFCPLVQSSQNNIRGPC